MHMLLKSVNSKGFRNSDRPHRQMYRLAEQSINEYLRGKHAYIS